MASRAKRAWSITLSVIVALLILFWAVSYHPWEFRGGLSLHDSGFFSYPRYHAQLGEVPIWKVGEYQFTVRGLPPEPLDLKLQVLDSTEANRAELIVLSTIVSVS